MKALICGVSGQDGAYLAKLLLAKGYEVAGTSRDAQVGSFANLERLGVRGSVRLSSMVLDDFRSVLTVLKQTDPEEIYNLAGQTSVGLSFEQPVETLESIGTGTVNLLEAIRFLGKPMRFYSAGSGECYGDTGGEAAREDTPFRPRSPYAVAKATAHMLVANYREAYGLHASTGVLFNHESPLRPQRIVTRKIVAAAAAIPRGGGAPLKLGNRHLKRDWGWAPEYVEAMWRMLQQDEAGDYVIATGESRSLEEFVAAAFGRVELDWRAHVDFSAEFVRPTDIAESRGAAAKALAVLGWSAQAKMDEVVARMVDAELGQASRA
jgi:GDPmannose 4,6-dehydratase